MIRLLQSARKKLAFLFLGLLLSGCKPPAQVQAPPPVVTVAKPVVKEIVEWLYFTAQSRAVISVEIRPRVSGYIDKITFQEGGIVEQGVLLFLIDPRPYQAALDQARGQLEQARAQQKLNVANLERAEDLFRRNVTAKQDYDTAVAQKNVSDAQVTAGQGAVGSAQLNLGFTEVKAPIRGRIDRQLVNLGNLVQADQTPLTSLVSIDPIYAYFNVDERTVMKIRQQITAGNLPSAEQISVPVYLQLETEEGFPHEGVIDFFSNTFDASTGTLQVRGRFADQDGSITPGAFGTVRVAGTPKHQAVLVADRSVGTDQDQKYVIVIQPDGIAKYQKIEMGPLVEGLRVVSQGLKGDETIVVEGISKVRPDSKVTSRAGDMMQFASDQLAVQAITANRPESGETKGAAQPKSDSNLSPAPKPVSGQ